jgi:hypothetical protein
MMFLSPAQKTSAYARGIGRAMFSFVRLDEKEAPDLKPLRLNCCACKLK